MTSVIVGSTPSSSTDEELADVVLNFFIWSDIRFNHIEFQLNVVLDINHEDSINTTEQYKPWILCYSSLKGYSSGQSHFSEINVKLAEKNKYATHSVQRSLETCANK